MMAICPEGYLCRYGCPMRRNLGEDMLRVEFQRQRTGPLDPEEPLPRLSIPFDPCAFVSCEPDRIFEPGGTARISLDLRLGLAGDLNMERPASFVFYVLDEAGDARAGGVAHFFSADQRASREALVTLSFPLNPSYARRTSSARAVGKGVPAALPAYYLVVQPLPGDERNQTILSGTPLEMKARVEIGRAAEPSTFEAGTRVPARERARSGFEIRNDKDRSSDLE
jgi:hypothetical protein